MANSDFSTLSNRNQSSLVSAIYKEISAFTGSFCLRPRVYIRNLSKIPGSIYWLQDGNNKLAAFAFIDPNHIFQIKGVTIQTLGHTIAKKPGYMPRLLNYLLEQKKDQNLALICKEFVYKSLNLKEGLFIPLKPFDIKKKLPELANFKTDYFGVKNEFLASALSRKNQIIYLKLTPEAKQKLNF